MKFNYTVFILEPKKELDTNEDYAYKVIQQYDFITKGEAIEYEKYFNNVNDGTLNQVLLRDYKIPVMGIEIE